MKNVTTKAVKAADTPPILPPLSYQYVGQDYENSIYFHDRWHTPKTWSESQIEEFTAKHPERAALWFKKL